jgi:hypothetical protein
MENKFYKIEDACKCPCHVKGGVVMHFMPCCDLCEEKYLNKDFTIDEAAYKAIVLKYSKD